mmetsp:Transcript_5842/g.14611  ORF Transcript_5842/g.14611 Transcript_5842/m.14611 type:complete len:209 (+) Transcript_5842:1009-1635(+)
MFFKARQHGIKHPISCIVLLLLLSCSDAPSVAWTNLKTSMETKLLFRSPPSWHRKPTAEGSLVRNDTNQHVSMATSYHVALPISFPLGKGGSASGAESSIETSLALKRGIICAPSTEKCGLSMSSICDAGTPPSRNELVSAQTEFRIKSIRDWVASCPWTKETPKDKQPINPGNAPMLRNASLAISESPARLPMAHTHFSHSSNPPRG